MSKHTPGPWEWVTKQYMMWHKVMLVGRDNSVIMHIGIDDSSTMEMEGDEPSNADKSLIAAAPELLEAAKGLLGLAERHGWLHVAVDAARAAIAKAEHSEDEPIGDDEGDA